MSKGINKVILVGNLGKDPEVRYTTSGAAVTKITVATSESWKDKNTGEDITKTEWNQVVFFGRLAEVAGEYLQKGRQVYIEGKLTTRKWQDNNGQDRYTTEIVANELQMLGSNPNQGQNQSEQQSNHNHQGQRQAQQQRPQQNQQSGGAQGYQQNQPNTFENFDDDIPF